MGISEKNKRGKSELRAIQQFRWACTQFPEIMKAKDTKPTTTATHKLSVVEWLKAEAAKNTGSAPAKVHNAVSGQRRVDEMSNLSANLLAPKTTMQHKKRPPKSMPAHTKALS